MSLLARRPALTSLLLGLIAATGFEPFAFWPATIAAIAVWLRLIHAAPGPRAALWRGWLFGLGQFGLALLWVQHPFTFQDAVPPVLGYGAVPLLAGYLALYPMLAAWIAWRFGRAAPAVDARFVLMFAAAWIATEWLRGTLLTGCPWNPLAAIWLPVPGVARAVAWVGSFTLSGLTVALAGALTLLPRGQWRLAAIVPGGAALLAVTAPAPLPPPPATAPRLLIVQPNLGEERRPGADYAERNLRRLLALSRRPPSAAPRLILWPEGAERYLIEDGYPAAYYLPDEAPITRARIASVLAPDDVVLTGGNALVIGPAGELTAVTNSVFAVDAQARLIGRYDKAHLVPFGEYLPLRPLTSMIGLDKLVPREVDFAPGPRRAALFVPGFGRIGIAICYEIIFAGQVVDRVHRPALIFNPSNDSWFGAWGPPQHLAQARLRAIEEGLPVLRATPTGVSAVIDADGRLLGTVGLGRAGVIDLPLPRAHPPTPFARLGNWLTLLAAALIGALAVAIRRRAR